MTILAGVDGKVRVLSTKGRLLPGLTTVERARVFINEGLATIVDESAIKVIVLKQNFRRHILSRDNNTCQYCGATADTIDHIIPVSKGGLDTPKNCVAACKTCNQVKDSRTLNELSEFKVDILSRIEELKRQVESCDFVIRFLESEM